jgi:hypothetical protein
VSCSSRIIIAVKLFSLGDSMIFKAYQLLFSSIETLIKYCTFSYLIWDAFLIVS